MLTIFSGAARAHSANICSKCRKIDHECAGCHFSVPPGSMTIVSLRPPSEAWAVAIHHGERSETLLGSGIVVDTNLVLTCAHVACSADDAPRDLWVSFPKADVGYWERRRVRQILINGRPDE